MLDESRADKCIYLGCAIFGKFALFSRFCKLFVRNNGFSLLIEPYNRPIIGKGCDDNRMRRTMCI